MFRFVFRMWVNNIMPFFVVSQFDHLFITYNSRVPEESKNPKEPRLLRGFFSEK